MGETQSVPILQELTVRKGVKTAAGATQMTPETAILLLPFP